jgi:hypothetical protein
MSVQPIIQSPEEQTAQAILGVMARTPESASNTFAKRLEAAATKEEKLALLSAFGKIDHDYRAPKKATIWGVAWAVVGGVGGGFLGFLAAGVVHVVREGDDSRIMHDGAWWWWIILGCAAIGACLTAASELRAALASPDPLNPTISDAEAYDYLMWKARHYPIGDAAQVVGRGTGRLNSEKL